jgi:uncharacterized membrane protein YczE
MRIRRVTRAHPDLEVVTFPSRAELLRRLPRLLGGIVVLGPGIALTLRARLGVSPWDVLHQGLAKKTGLSFGVVVVLVGVGVLLVWIPLRQRFGVGTVINTLTVGFLVDFALDVLPEPHLLAARWALLLGGIVMVALGMGLYISAGLGPGPRDGLMTGIAAKGLPVWAVRTVLELSALLIGWALGGNVGVGTVIFAFAIGPLGHFFLSVFHLGPAPSDLGPGVAAE